MKSNNSSSSLALSAALVVLVSSLLVASRRRRKRRDDDGSHTSSDTCGNDTTADTAAPSCPLGVNEEYLPSHVRREMHKHRKRMSKAAMLSMKTPMYDNVFMLSTEGQPMCTISMKKAKWYLKKGIAEWSSLPEHKQWTPEEKEGGAKCIRLLFEHNGSKERDTTSPESVYLRSVKKNICVSCGDDGHHMRHYIIPYAYRSLLPNEYKSHMSHDICILCPECHVDCERHSKRRMKQMERDLRTRLGREYNEPAMIEDPILYHVRSCALALVKSRERMPLERIKEYEVVVREYLASTCEIDSEEELTKAELEKACAVNHKVKNRKSPRICVCASSSALTRIIENMKQTSSADRR
ncbi:hypothetical protein THAOC_07901 [Thalassiosira oceanica]|uniref:HNH domain-containing protein n=2 Tax=Thalassiosira oceanica TaxID=159749 RepID=K0T0N0_THAOC|nr:hypothetical protein THAOC_07901 [Thalassiosira oceanica]|eukprot:EJK70719.1 hypothetical protein THAOC_07901 [Thalassiosira oceanica]